MYSPHKPGFFYTQMYINVSKCTFQVYFPQMYLQMYIQYYLSYPLISVSSHSASEVFVIYTLNQKQKEERWYPDFAWKSIFPQRTLRRLLVQCILSKSNYCSLLANVELVCLHGSMVLMCSLWLTNHWTPIWDKWTISDAVKPSCFELILYSK